jgi:hypothetical protein
MYEISIAIITSVCLLISYWIGHLLYCGLPEHRRTAEIIIVVRLVVGILITFTALILSLLTNSVKSSFDYTDSSVREYATQLIGLDKLLRDYGPEADPMRDTLKSYVGAAIASTWTGERVAKVENLPSLDNGAKANDGLEGKALGEMLYAVESGIRALDPGDRVHQLIAQDARLSVRNLLATRWRLIESQHSSIPKPFLALLIVWLMIIFASFGANIGHRLLISLTVCLVAAALSSVIYLILDLDSVFDGLIAVSSAPFKDALAHMQR